MGLLVTALVVAAVVLRGLGSGHGDEGAAGPELPDDVPAPDQLAVTA